MTEQVRPSGIRRLYAWMMRNAQGRHAWAALACFAFAEASFFPIPPDVMLLPMMLANRRRALLVARCKMGDDELVEVTPQSIRLRKRVIS